MGISARDVIMKEYNGSVNFMTPHIIGYKWIIKDKLACELSRGKGLFDRTIYGVSVVLYDKETKKTKRLTQYSDCFTSEKDADNYIRNLYFKESLHYLQIGE